MDITMQITAAADYIRTKTSLQPEIGLILGSVPLIFKNPADYDLIEENDSLKFIALPSQLAPGSEVTGTLVKSDGTEKEIVFVHPLSENDIRLVKAGGRLNC